MKGITNPFSEEKQLPTRGTGQEIGTAREDSGNGKPLTEPERIERHSKLSEEQIAKIDARTNKYIDSTIKPLTIKEQWAAKKAKKNGK